MKKVIVHLERCVGCMQCQVACAVAHSKSKDLFGALLENPRPRPRIHVGAGPADQGFPNRCRHCDPAPCLAACLPGAISRTASGDTVLIDPTRCINCASCAMACPFGVPRYYRDAAALPGKTVAVKCDNCLDRQEQGLVPACVEACKTGALTFEDENEAQKRRTAEVSRAVWSEGQYPSPSGSPGFDLLNAVKRARKDLAQGRGN